MVALAGREPRSVRQCLAVMVVLVGALLWLLAGVAGQADTQVMVDEAVVQLTDLHKPLLEQVVQVAAGLHSS